MKKNKNKQPKTSIRGISGRHEKKTYKDLKREAIIRGMPFLDVVSSGIGDLICYIDNSDEKPNLKLIDKFDDWVDSQLESLGYEQGTPLRSPMLRLGFIGVDEEGNNRVKKKVKGIPKPKKEKRERDTNGLYKGTKKAYTFELASRGYPLERVIKRVHKKFPDASDKSINIWFRNAQKVKK